MHTMEEFSTLEANIKAALVATTKSANLLASEDLQFHRSLDSSVGPALDKQNARLLGLADRLVGAATANTEIVRAPRLKSLESVEGNWRAVVDVVDSLLERADTALDEFTGAVKRLSPGVEQVIASRPPKPGRIASALRGQDLEKPQLKFDHVPTNDEVLPFKPLLQSKPHAVVPLETEPIASDPDTQAAYPHPYQLEIEQYRYPSSIYAQSEPIMYHPFETTTATFVDTEEAVAEMLEELKQAKEIAIDLEHHDNRSYIGIVSLMQISTRDKDWIVDTLKPWRRKLQCLNEVFTNPNIIKVLHGAYMDVVWLQRDLGLYLVGLFDTHYAARALGYTGGSLAFLLKRFANVEAQKQYQMADWRVRPLPKELLDYARSDTHYLLYIFDNMRNELIQKSDFSQPEHGKDRLWDVLQRSSEVALQRYEHPIYDEELGQGGFGWYKLLARNPAMLTKEQFAVFRAVHKWRDDVAREQDDSLHYIMPNHQIFSIARAMPPTRLALLGVATPPSQTLRLRADELVSVVTKAKASGKDGPDMIEVLNKVEPQRAPKSAAAERPSSPATVAAPQVANGITPTSSLPIRSSTSSFWGSAFDSSVWEGQKRSVTSTTPSLSLAVPLPPLNADIFADPGEATPSKAEMEPSPGPVPAKQEPSEGDDVFVLKDLSRKRKRGDEVDADADSMAANTDEVALDLEEDEAIQRARRKAERKTAKKAAKKAAKAATGAGQGEDGIAREAIDEDEETPYDYANASSILNPPRENDGLTAKERKKKAKQINPYAKSLDTAKGVPRGQKERAGRSMTFKK